MSDNSGKAFFYPKVRAALVNHGYRYYDGDTDIRGFTRSHKCRPDYIAVKNRMTVIGEIKSPCEGPMTSSWRTVQKSDSAAFAQLRQQVAADEQAGLLDRSVGGHIIIIKGQIADYIAKKDVTYHLPPDVNPANSIVSGYSVPIVEKNNVERALLQRRITCIETIEIGNDVITFVF